MERIDGSSKTYQARLFSYSLRGFYITQSILNGIDMLLIAKNCGNSLTTILKHYEFIDMERQTKDLIKRRNVKGEVSNEVII